MFGTPQVTRALGPRTFGIVSPRLLAHHAIMQYSYRTWPNYGSCAGCVWFVLAAWPLTRARYYDSSPGEYRLHTDGQHRLHTEGR